METRLGQDAADPHAGQPILAAGPALERASAVLVLLHGRGGTASDMLSLHAAIDLPDLAALAPQAAGHTWYPHSFLSPLDSNQPFLDSALKRIEGLIADVEGRGISSDRIALLGFSQGACLAVEFSVRHPRRYGALFGLTGGLIGPPGTPRDYPGTLAGTPVFLGTSDPDPHIPFERVQETQAVLAQMGAAVELRRYPGMPHTINAEEIAICREYLRSVLAHSSARRRRSTASRSVNRIHVRTKKSGSHMNPTIGGIHHVTAITADAQRNIDFYCDVLGLRLVKLTVNFDDPGSYHLYYGDDLGRPGTILTFFAWPGGNHGHIGPPQVTSISFAAPAAALDFWSQRLSDRGVETQALPNRFGEAVIGFADPDGLKLEIVGSEVVGSTQASEATTGPIPTEQAIRGFHGVTVSEEGYERTANLLTEVLGFRSAGSEQNRFRYLTGTGHSAAVVDLRCAPGAPKGAMGTGVVHHVAFRTPDDSQQSLWRGEIVQRGYNVSPIMDRLYFHSIYFREPGGVLFEIATDNPGFTRDENSDRLGTSLMLPAQFEPYRTELERALPRLRLPEWKRRGGP